jgi:hypothetical protein
MENWLYDMEWVVAMRNELLTPVFKSFSALGYGGFLLLFFTIGYWIFSKKTFSRVGLWLLLSVLLNAYLKDLFQDPRPDPILQLDPHVGQSYGFPSGHAQIAVVIWFWIAWQARKRSVWILSSILVIAICFSRLYLGVHDMEDVLGGMGIGLLSLLIFISLTTKKFEWLHNLNTLWQVFSIILIEAFFFLTWPGKPQGRLIGLGVFLIGFWIIVCIDRKRVFFQKHPDWWRVIASGVIGLIVLIALQKGLGGLETGRTDIVLTRVFISGIYMIALTPLIFQLFKLGDKDDFVDG